MEEKVYDANVGEHSQRQDTSGKAQSGQDPDPCGNRKREGNQVLQPGGQRYKKGQVIKMSGLFMEKPLGARQSSHWKTSFQDLRSFNISVKTSFV